MHLLRYLFLTLVLLPGFLASQATFRLDSIPAYTPPDDYIYIAGNFNGWQPGDVNYRLSKDGQGKWWITLAAMQQGTAIQFKFTRGSWETVEKGPNGEELDNRTFTFGNGDTVGVIIHNWAQGGGGSTAADNVIVMDEDFFMPQLNRNRRIWLYLPPDYETSGKKYPVLYMHDGQNLFDASTSFAGEWEVDETLNGFYDQGLNVPIVVGIDNGGADRPDELTPWPHAIYGGGDGDLYMAFIVETLKPYIDGNYRTMSDRDQTGIMGSSLGGLISHFGALNYQEVFSKAGIFSPSYWFSDSVWIFTRLTGKLQPMRLYQMAGGGEGQGTLNNMLDMQDSLLAAGFSTDEITTKIIPGGEHNENLWRQDFGEAYLWLFASFASGIRAQEETRNIRLFPNPSGEIVNLPPDFPDRCDSVVVLNMQGQTVLKMSPFHGHALNVSSLPAGTYLVTIVSGKTLYQGKFVKE
jgi:predicted alpha/beta superfamily hydrolase